MDGYKDYSDADVGPPNKYDMCRRHAEEAVQALLNK
jgi:hypothetical protein